MRLALVVNNFPKLSETFVYNRVQKLLERGYFIDVYTSSKNNDSEIISDIRHKNLKVIYSRSFFVVLKIIFCSIFDFLFYKGLMLNYSCGVKEIVRFCYSYSLLRRFSKYDIVHFEFSSLGLQFEKELKFFDGRLNIVASCRGSAELVAPFFSNTRLKSLVVFLNECKAIHCVSYDMKHKLITYGVNSLNYSVIFPAVDLNKMKYKFNSRTSGDVFQLVFVGRMEWIKFPEMALMAILELVKRNRQIVLNIIGDGAELKKLHFISQVLGIKEYVNFLGALSPSEVSEQLRLSHALILTSWSEGISNVVLEAKASGPAVICSDVGGMSEVSTNMRSCLFYKIGNLNELVEKIDILYLDESLREEISIRARHEVEQMNNIEEQLARFDNLYKSVKK